MLFLFHCYSRPCFCCVRYLQHSVRSIGESPTSPILDDFLAEAGVIAVIASQLWTFFDNRRQIDDDDDGGSTAATTATSLAVMGFRWLLFRRMFLSGIAIFTEKCRNNRDFVSLTSRVWKICAPQSKLWMIAAFFPANFEGVVLLILHTAELWFAFWMYAPKAAKALRLV